MADAYGHAFWWAVALLAAAYLGAVLLPWRKPRPQDADEEPGERPAAMLMHA